MCRIKPKARPGQTRPDQAVGFIGIRACARFRPILVKPRVVG